MKHVALLSLAALTSTLGLVACSSSNGDTTGSAGGKTTGTGSSTGAGPTTGSGGSGGSTTGTGGTGGTTFVPGTPITATDSTWTWIPFPDSACGNGSATGIGVNLSTKSSRVLVYLEGGGACWSDLTCNTVMTASNLGGYSETTFNSELAQGFGSTASGNFFDRTSTANPFQDYSYVYVPYCTGDIHGGNNVASYGTHHMGFANMTAYLKRIVPTFPTAERVILAGSSAGGYGAAFNWFQTQEAFGKIRVDMIDDSGTPMPPDVEAEATGFGFAANGAGESLIRASWGLEKTFPPGCTECNTRLDALFGFYAKTYPDHRAALMSFTQDSVLPTFYGITTAQFTTGLNEEIAATFTSANAGFQYFTVDKSSHVLWFTPSLTPSTTSTFTLQQFVTAMVTDDPAWTSEHP